MTDGSVKCWGRGLGELVEAGTNDQTTPADVMGLSAPATSLAVGQDVTCALLTTGGVECWGDNYYGQLGNGSTESSDTPVPVSGLAEGVLAIASANAHVCALLTSGEMRCWGYNFNSEVGTDEGDTHVLPRVVEGATDVKAMALGALHTCVLLTTGGVQCWGHGEFGALGNGDATTSAQPVNVVGLDRGVTTLAAGQYHNCGVLGSGELVCWGDNTDGNLGIGDTGTQFQFVPAPVIGF
jgi:alpha-tubulin suppressor-like RCC1 family protein